MFFLKQRCVWNSPGAKSLARLAAMKCLKQSWSWLVTFSPSQFQHIWTDPGTTAPAYNGHPLAEMNSRRRGRLLEDWARMMLKERDPNCLIDDALPGRCINGQRRGPMQTEYDFTLNGRRVEIKSSQLQWDSGTRCWKFQFRGVKLERFAELYLVLFSPQWLHLVKHDLKTGVSSTGVLMENGGCKITIYGGQNKGWPDALDRTLEKLCWHGNCTLLRRNCLNDSAIAELCAHNSDWTSQFYIGLPLGSMSPQLRGLRVQSIVFEICKLLFSNSDFAELSYERACSGRRRGSNSASCDFLRDEQRIEVKHSQLRFGTGIRWHCSFANVKQSCFDVLLLTIHSPQGLDIFEHNGSFGLSTAGLKTEHEGKGIAVAALKGELDPMKVWKPSQRS